MIDELAFNAELRRKIRERRQEKAAAARRFEQAVLIHRDIKQRIRLVRAIQNSAGWPTAELQKVGTQDWGPYRIKEVQLVHLCGDEFVLPLGELQPDGVYLGKDGNLYEANPLLWEEPYRNLTPFLQIRLGNVVDIEKLQLILVALNHV